MFAMLSGQNANRRGGNAHATEKNPLTMQKEGSPQRMESRKKRVLRLWRKRAWMGGRGKGNSANKKVKKSASKPVDYFSLPPEGYPDIEEPLLSSPPELMDEREITMNDGEAHVKSAGSVTSILKRRRPKQTIPETPEEPVDASDSSLDSSSSRSIRFADEEGKPISTVQFEDEEHIQERQDQRQDWVRFIVLMISPEFKKFEFVHVYYHTKESTSLRDVMPHIRNLATHRDLAKQHYVGLCRLKDGGRELINTRSLQDYELDRHEVVAAIPEGMKGSELVRLAFHIVKLNKKILRVMKRTPWSLSRIPKQRNSRDLLTENICLKELELALVEEDTLTIPYNWKKSDRSMIPQLVHASAFLVPLFSVREKASPPPENKRAFFLKRQ